MNVEIDVPSKLSDLTLEQYQLFMRLVDKEDSEEFIGQKMIAIFCKIKLSQVVYFNALSTTETIQSLTSMFEGEKKFINRFELGGKEFGFIPCLEDMSFGEYIDLETNIAEWDNMHKAMAVMFRPIVKTKGKDKYDIEPYEGTATYSEVMKYAPLDVVMGAMVFFYNLNNELLMATLHSLEVEAIKMDLQKKNSSASPGDGINLFTPSLEETFKTLKELQGLGS
jgi:hypothetical protein